MHTTSPFTDRDAAALDSVVRGLETLEQQVEERTLFTIEWELV